MTHSELQEQVTQLCTLTGWAWLHVRRSIGKGQRWTTATNIVGWPDLAPLWNPRQPGRFLAIEVKVDTRFQPGQLETLQTLRSCGMETYVVWSGVARIPDVPAASAELVNIVELATILPRPRQGL